MTAVAITSRPTITDANRLVENLFDPSLTIVVEYVEKGDHGIGGGFAQISLVDAVGKYVPEWSNKPVPADFLLTPRGLVEKGDMVVSSHAGVRKVTRAETQGTVGPGTTYLYLEGITGPEAYPADDLIPTLAHSGPSNEVRALATIEALDRLITKVAKALDPTHVDLTLARCLLIEMQDVAMTTTVSLVKDQALSDRIAGLARTQVRKSMDTVGELREAALTHSTEA